MLEGDESVAVAVVQQKALSLLSLVIQRKGEVTRRHPRLATPITTFHDANASRPATPGGAPGADLHDMQGSRGAAC